MSGYNLTQQAFVLSIKANQLALLNGNAPDTKPNLERRLYEYLAQFLRDNTDALGPWSVVWGPAVYISPKYNEHPDVGVPDNAVFVAKKDVSPPVYVVAVAGTNRASKFGWDDEDGAVGTTVAWVSAFTHDQNGSPLLPPYQNPSDAPNPALSRGTATGVQILLSTVPDPATNPDDPAPVRLSDFLAGLPASQATAIVAGHSLGGALSPTLALALFNPRGGPVDPTRWAAIYTLPTAGATPGNADFASAFASVFPPIPTLAPEHPDPSLVELWNRNIGNTRDFVPLAWVPSQLDTVPPPLLDRPGGLYPDLRWVFGLKPQLRIAIDAAKYLSAKGARSMPDGGGNAAGPYTPLPSLPFDWPELADPTALIGSLVKAPPDPQTQQSYIYHWAVQHSVAYLEFFKVDDLLNKQESIELLIGSGLSLLRLAEQEPD